MAVRTTLLALLLAVALHALMAQGARVERQPRLGREEAEPTPQLLHDAGLYAAAYSAGGPAPTVQRHQQQQPEPQRGWWQRWLWPWRTDPQRAVRVMPIWADGTPASLVDLELPQSHIERELCPAAGDGLGDLYNYNSSAMTPLIPWSWSWMSDVQQMRNRSNGFDIDTARTLSIHAAITYCNISNLAPWNCSRCGGPAAGFSTHRVVYDPLWNLLAYVGVSSRLRAIIVSFRGTDSHSLYNWAENMRTWRTDLQMNYPDAPRGALVHGGFFYSYNSSVLAANVTQAVQELWQGDQGLPVYVVGHSLGGALATISALDIRLNLGIEDVRLYTFGSPRVGNAIFAEWFRAYVKVRWRFTHNRDMVPSVPIQLMGFRHVAQEVWLLELDAEHTLVGMCDESGEDPRCHNSMCYMGLCSSIADHLLYLSEMYTPRPGGC